MLQVERLHARYGRAPVLFGLSFAIAAGEQVALLGRNGAGKSTTLKSVMGLLRPAAGRILVDGADVAGWAPHRIARAGVGYVPEDRRIFADLTVAENLAVGARPGGWAVEHAYALFPALAAMRDRAGGNLSGGEQQMLTLARTLLGAPRLLLLDEPTEGLSPAAVGALEHALAHLRDQGVAMLIAEQNLQLAAKLAVRAVVLDRGTLAWAGPTAAAGAWFTQAHAAATVPGGRTP